MDVSLDAYAKKKKPSPKPHQQKKAAKAPAKAAGKSGKTAAKSGKNGPAKKSNKQSPKKGGKRLLAKKLAGARKPIAKRAGRRAAAPGRGPARGRVEIAKAARYVNVAVDATALIHGVPQGVEQKGLKTALERSLSTDVVHMHLYGSCATVIFARAESARRCVDMFNGGDMNGSRLQVTVPRRQ